MAQDSAEPVARPGRRWAFPLRDRLIYPAGTRSLPLPGGPAAGATAGHLLHNQLNVGTAPAASPGLDAQCGCSVRVIRSGQDACRPLSSTLQPSLSTSSMWSTSNKTFCWPMAPAVAVRSSVRNTTSSPSIAKLTGTATGPRSARNRKRPIPPYARCAGHSSALTVSSEACCAAVRCPAVLPVDWPRVDWHSSSGALKVAFQHHG